MLTFFRRIRKSLLGSGQARKYILYATGEVLLVMVGILLALQVNNWNENLKTANKANAFLVQILNDLKIENSIYTEKYNIHLSQIKQNKDAIELLYTTQENHSEAVKFYLKQFDQQSDDLVPIDATYKQILSSGEISAFSNKTLASQIVNYYQTNYDAALQVKEFNDVIALERTLAKTSSNIYQLKYAADFHKHPKMFDDGDWTYLNDPTSLKFKVTDNILTLNIFREKDHASRMKKLLKLNEQLQNEIIKELGEE